MPETNITLVEEARAAARGLMALLTGDRGAARYFTFTQAGLVSSFIAVLFATGVELVAGAAMGGGGMFAGLVQQVIIYAAVVGASALYLRQIGRWDALVPFVVTLNWSNAILSLVMLVTLLLGLSFLLTQVIEYHRIGFNTGDSSFAATFFGLTGLHGAHVFVGLTILLVMTIRAFRGHFSPEHHHGVEIGGIYWHFVDVMWIVVYVTVYLL